MPRVPLVLPTANEQVGSSTPAVAPDVVAQPDVVSPQLTMAGRGIAAAGVGAMDYARVMQVEIDDARTKDGYTKLADSVATLLNDPKNGYLSRVGEQAVGGSRAVLDSAEQLTQKIEKSLDNDVQRQMFRQAASKMMVGVKERVYSHETEQVRVYNIGRTSAMVEQEAQAAIEAKLLGPVPPEVTLGGDLLNRSRARGGDVFRTGGGFGGEGEFRTGGGFGGPPEAAGGPQKPEKKESTFDLHYNTALEQAAVLARLRGLSKEEAGQLALKVKSGIHGGVVERLLSAGRTDHARAYLSGVKTGDLDPGVRAQLEGQVRQGTINDEAFEVANRVMTMVTQSAVARRQDTEGIAITEDDVFDGESMLAARKAIEQDKSLSTEVKRAARAELDSRFDARRVAWMERGNQALVETERWLGANTMLSVASPSFPVELKQRLTKFGKLDEAARLRVKDTDPSTYAQLLADSDAGLLQSMSKTELFYTYYANLGPAEWNEAVSMLNAAHSGNKADDTFYGVREATLKAAVDVGILKTAKVPDPTNREESRQYYLFAKELQNRINATPGAKDNPKEVERIVTEMGLERAANPGLFGGSDFYWRMTPKQQEEAVLDLDPSRFSEIGVNRIDPLQIAKLSRTDYDAIKQLFIKKWKREPSKAEIWALWAKHKDAK